MMRGEFVQLVNALAPVLGVLDVAIVDGSSAMSLCVYQGIRGLCG